MLFDKRWEYEVPAKPIDDVSRVLYQAADIISHMGLCKGQATDKWSRHCAGGAIVEAALKGRYGPLVNIFSPFSESAIKLALGRLRRTIGTHAFASWNDDPERTEAEVVAALRRAALEP